MGTHDLLRVEESTTQNTKRKRASVEHSLPMECRERNKSGHRNERVRVTHKLLSAEGGTGQDAKEKGASDGYSPPVQCGESNE
jgi:hypothetical protein